MLTVDESISYKEIEQVVHKITEEDFPVSCITEHPGFNPVCLNIHVLQAAYFACKQIHGVLDKPTEEKYRYTAYRQFVRWCWEYIGKNIRVPLPSCVTAVNRQKFNSPYFVGFKHPQI